MGKPLPSAARLRNFARIISSDRIAAPKQGKPTSKTKVSHSISPEKSLPKVARVDPSQLGRRMENSAIRARLPLSHVVSDCVRRWFQDTLKEAKAGDSGMQLLVGQMYNSGYGVRKDTDKGRTWITIAAKGRSSAWKVSNKQPGYNASDSESEDLKEAKS
uniref:Uncharacterized protein n=2 Tax=Opuntia streptacantha TaxID=393608 RepID=A0A7C9ETU6_OPUST